MTKSNMATAESFGADLAILRVADRPRGLLEHRLDGRFRPMDPNELQSIVRGLLPRIDLTGVDYILGLPEGGTLIALTLAQAAGLPLVLSTRMNVPLEGSIYFEEPHSVTQDRHNWVYAVKPGDRVVIADDEFTTGRTVANAITALRAAGAIVDQIVVLIASQDPEATERMGAIGIRVHAAVELSPQMAGAVLGRTG